MSTTIRCKVCNSDRIIPNVRIIDCAGESGVGDLRLVVYGAPDALIFKDRHFESISAQVCGDCGHLEFRVSNPQQLYEAFLKSQP